VRNNSKSREDENVYFWVSEESEQVLVKNWVSSPRRIKESGVEVSICEEHSNPSSKDRKGKE